MPVVFAALTPHSPLLIPSIGTGKGRETLSQTTQALEKLSSLLKATKVDTIIVISPHISEHGNNLQVTFHSEYIGKFEDFGDYDTAITCTGDMVLANHIRQHVEHALPVVFPHKQNLDYGTSIPLFYLHKDKAGLAPVGTAAKLDYETHFRFGEKIKSAIAKSKKRVAVIASGDLSHRLSTDSPAGFSDSGKKFDKTLLSLITEKNVTGLRDFDASLASEAMDGALRPIITLHGIISRRKYSPKVLSYEGPLGIGYAVIHFSFTSA